MLIPSDNAKDLPEIPDNVKEGMEIIPVDTVTEVLSVALAGTPQPVEWDPNAEPLSPAPGDDDASASLHH